MNTPSCLLRRSAALGALLLLAAAATPVMASRPALVADARISIELAPPAPREEIVVERDRPSPEHVWIKGYWAWRDGHHVWVHGRWERPPHRHAVWIEPRWEHRGHSYVFIDGYWR